MEGLEVTDYLSTPVARDAAAPCKPVKSPPHAPPTGYASSWGDDASVPTRTSTFHFTFTTPWVAGGDGGGHSLLLPVKVSLPRLTVASLVDEFTARLQRRYGGAARRPLRLLLREGVDVADGVAAADLPGLDEATSMYAQMRHRAHAGAHGVRPHPSASPASAVAAGVAHMSGSARAPAAAIDTVMNAEDTLDCFIPPPLMPRALSDAAPVYDIQVEEWSDTAAADGGVVGAGTMSQQRTLAQSGRSGNPLAEARRPPGTGLAVALPQAQRSTYVDLLLHRRRIRGEGAAGVSGLDWDSFVAAGSDSDGEDGVMAIRGGGGVGCARSQASYAARAALADAEQAARRRCEGDEASARSLVVSLHDDKLRGLLMVEALQGQFAGNSRLTALLHKHHVYPLDTVPLVEAVPPEERARLATNADNTALLSFQFLDASPKPVKTEGELLQEKMRVPYLTNSGEPSGVVSTADRPKSYSELMTEAIEFEQAMLERDERGMTQVAHYLERGELLPSCDPTPSLPPATPHVEDLPADVLQPAMDVYIAGRHDIIRCERVVFRDITRAMRSILDQQMAADAAAVARGYRDELVAAEKIFSFDFDGFNQVWGPGNEGEPLAAAAAAAPGALEKPVEAEGVATPSLSAVPSTPESVDEEGAEIIYKFPTPRQALR